MKLRCGACFATPGWKGRLLGEVDPDSGRLVDGDRTERIVAIGDRYRVQCHPRRCGAEYVLSVGALARACAAVGGRGELLAGVHVGRQVTDAFGLQP